MKLKDYFREQKEYTINQNDKFFLYEKIISQKDQKSFARTKRFVSIRSFAYGFAMIILFVWIYGVYFLNGDISYEWFMVQNTLNQVNADYIAKIVDFNGNFYIKHEWEYYKTSNISNGDNIILKKWSEIVFHMDSWTKAKIVGPARFTLNKADDTYQLLISQWDFIQMESLDNNSNSIKVVLNDITVSSQQNTNFLITKENDKYKINNQWDKIIITQADSTRELQNKQLLTIQDNDITLIENIENFGQAVTQNNVSQTFAIADNTTTKIKEEQIINTLLNDTDSKNNEITNPKLAEDLWLIDNKQIPTTEQSKTLHSLLNNNFVLWNIEEMFKAHTVWNEKEYIYNQWLLESRIQKIYNLFDIKYPSWNLTSNINTLKLQLTNNYHIPSKYTQNLNTIANRIVYIQNNTYWLTTNIEEIDQLWNKLETNTPNNLVLK